MAANEAELAAVAIDDAQHQRSGHRALPPADRIGTRREADQGHLQHAARESRDAGHVHPAGIPDVLQPGRQHDPRRTGAVGKERPCGRFCAGPGRGSISCASTLAPSAGLSLFRARGAGTFVVAVHYQTRLTQGALHPNTGFGAAVGRTAGPSTTCPPDPTEGSENPCGHTARDDKFGGECGTPA